MQIGFRAVLVQAVMTGYVRGAAHAASLASRALKERLENRGDPGTAPGAPSEFDRELLLLQARTLAEEIVDRLWRGVGDAAGAGDVSKRIA